MKVFLCVREYSTIDNYPTVEEQIQLAKDYVGSNGLTIVNLEKDKIVESTNNIIDYCIDNKIGAILAYDYRTLAYKSINRVKFSKDLHSKNIKILFFG